MTASRIKYRSEGAATVYRLLLFVAGDEPNSRLAKENLALLRRSLPEQHYEVQIVDVLEDYQKALDHKVLVTPCLLLLEPGPVVRVVGALSNMQLVRKALRLPHN